MVLSAHGRKRGKSVSGQERLDDLLGDRGGLLSETHGMTWAE